MEDIINRPKHYTTGSIEVIDFLEDQKLNHHEATAVAYICRAKHKGKYAEDIRKAIWYLTRLVSNLEKDEGRGNRTDFCMPPSYRYGDPIGEEEYVRNK